MKNLVKQIVVGVGFIMLAVGVICSFQWMISGFDTVSLLGPEWLWIGSPLLVIIGLIIINYGLKLPED